MTAAHIAGLLALAACTTPWETSSIDGLRQLDASLRVGTAARLRLQVPVEAGDQSLSFTMTPETEGVLGYVEQITAPDGTRVLFGEDWWDAPYTRTNGVFANTVTTVSWPILPTDVPLLPGDWVITARFDHRNLDATAAVSIKHDDDLSAGTLHADIVFAGDLGEDDELVRGTRAAVQRWSEIIYADAGITVEPTFRSDGASSDLPSPNETDTTVYREISEGRSLRAVTVVIVENITALPGVLGVSGDVPGAMVPTIRSAVTVSALAAAGRDGQFSAREEALFGETIAHEASHYLGLFHPVELPLVSAAPDTWDSIDDTPECDDLAVCTDLLAGNLMFPTPVCDDFTLQGCEAYVPQVNLTPTQTAVLHRHVSVE